MLTVYVLFCFSSFTDGTVCYMELFTVGPVACYPEVREEMKRQMFSHRSEEYRKLHRETVELLQEFMETESQVFLFSSTGARAIHETQCSVQKTMPKRYIIK
jgi:aspartate aminotransferase-like enzyme